MSYESEYHEQYRRAYNTAISAHFREAEFMCSCKGRFCDGLYEYGIDRKLLILLETMRWLACQKTMFRKAANRPITIISGYRCRQRNLLPKPLGVGGAQSSQHMLATAADIVISGLSPFKVRKIARKAFRKLRRTNPDFKGLGFGLGRYPTFTHCDVRRNKARW